jgi:hypothetical protein
MLLLELKAFVRNTFLQLDYGTAVSALQATITVSAIYIFTISYSALKNLLITHMSEYLSFESLLSKKSWTEEPTSFFPGSVRAKQFWSAAVELLTVQSVWAPVGSEEHGVHHKINELVLTQNDVFNFLM